MSITIQDIAKMLDLSHATVSRVLNQRDDRFISKTTRERVWKTARDMGYRPNRAARALVTGRTQQVGLLLSSLYTAFHAQVVHAVEEQLRDSGYQVVIGVIPPEITLDWHGSWHVDAYLVFEGAHLFDALRQLPETKIPLAVTMGGTNFEAEGIDCVGIDLGAGAKAALAHLDAQGFQKIAYVGERYDGPRLAAYRQFVAETNRKEECILVGSQQRKDVREAVREYLRTHPAPDALFCFNDDVALASYRALRDLGIDIPARVAITGCDGIEDTEYLDVPITTVRLPLLDMCRQAWQMLHARLDDPTRPSQKMLLQPELIVRESTRPRGDLS